MRHLKNKHAGETAVVIGNGPSLEKVDLRRLAEKYVTFGSNRIYTYPFVPVYYAICDDKMMHSCIEDIQRPDFTPAEMFIPRQFPLPGANLVNYVVEYDFSKDPNYKLVMGGTVTYVLLQLAYYMGFSTVLLVGVDHNYPGAGVGGKPGSGFIAGEADPDHFTPADGKPYFTKGRLFNRPELSGTEHSYQLAKQVYEADKRKIINCTSNSRLLVYDKDSIKKFY